MAVFPQTSKLMKVSLCCAACTSIPAIDDGPTSSHEHFCIVALSQFSRNERRKAWWPVDSLCCRALLHVVLMQRNNRDWECMGVCSRGLHGESPRLQGSSVRKPLSLRVFNEGSFLNMTVLKAPPQKEP